MTATIPHQAIYRRWRAQTFREIVGQEAVVETLRNGVRTGRVAHAVLFVGPRGTGKTSLARILAKALNCTDLQDGDACDVCPSCVAIREGVTLDLVEIDAASNNGIESIRNLRERLPYPPGELRRKVYILDEAHQITAPAWNALLKSIEEPPEFVNFMFASTEPSKFPPAILSRLQRYDVRRLTVPEIEGKLERILAADGRTAEPEAIHLIARLAAGGMRDAESMLDQLLSAAPDAIDERRVRDLLGLADPEAVTAFVDALVTGNAAAGIALLDSLEERGRDARTLLDQVIDEIRAELVRSLSSGDATTTAGLADAARRLAAIDPDRAGVGGLRLQLELALFADAGPGATHAGTVAAPTRGASSAPVQRAVAITAEPPRRPDPARPPQATSRVATPTDDAAPGAEPDARSAAEPVIPDPVRRARTEPAVASPPAAEPPPGVDTAPTAEAAPAVDAPPTTAELPAAIDAPPTAAELPAAIDAPPTAAELPAAIDAPPTPTLPAARRATDRRRAAGRHRRGAVSRGTRHRTCARCRAGHRHQAVGRPDARRPDNGLDG